MYQSLTKKKAIEDKLKFVSSSSQNLRAKQSMKSVAQHFPTHGELIVHALHIAYTTLNLLLFRMAFLRLVYISKGSRQLVVSDLPENRTHMFKPMNVLKQLDDIDLDVFYTEY